MNTKPYPRPQLTNTKTAVSPDTDHAAAFRQFLGVVARVAEYLRTYPLGCEIAALRIKG